MRLTQNLFGTTFQNPILLAAGTCGFGEELSEIIDLDQLGGLVTKSVTVEPRSGNPAPRVAEFPEGMFNSIGLANPGVDGVRATKLPWLAANVRKARVFVSVAGHTEEEYVQLIQRLDDADGFVGFELNLSCPNDHKRGGLPFALDLEALPRVVEACRALTERPMLAKLAPNTPDLGVAASTAESAGADGVTLVNTLPSLAIDPVSGQAALGAGAGGMSGPALLPVGVHAVYRARRATRIPIVGAGGVLRAEDAVQYLRAGASLVQMGTASFADPHAGLRVIDGLERFGRRHGIADVADLIATAELPWGDTKPQVEAAVQSQ